jgi:hypothetical protein
VPLNARLHRETEVLSGSIRKLALAAAAAVAALVVCAAGFGDPPSPGNPAGRSGDILGIVPVQSQAGHGGGGGSNLTFHGGPVMHTNTTFAIYWVPSGYSVSSSYEGLLNQFLGDVAADSGKSSNVYFSDTQYYDSTNGNILYSSTFAAANEIVDTNPFPASGCSDRYTSICLTDAQLRTEIDNLIAAKGLPRGLGTMYFIFTPRNVGSCFGSSCAFTYFCAYHSSFGSGSNVTLYANMPYAAWVPAACGSGQSPNNDDADSTISVVSHEHNETITDPLGNAWYDRRGQEDGDKCAWNFGSALGSTSSGSYNQVINSHTYYVQQEWSNYSSGCVLTGL